MKKLLLSALALTMTMGMSAQRWDFTNWSAETVANLLAVNPANNEWSDIEKSDGTAPTDISKENCFWEVASHGTDEGAELTANGVVIKETAGLLFTHTGKNRSLAIAVNYPETSIGTYNGPSYLWLGSKTINYFVIPNVKPGTEITIGVESHKNSDARGVELYVGRGNSGTKLNDPDGNAITMPTTYVEQVFFLPEDLTDTPNEDGTFDITVRNTNGCHLYFIQVGDGETIEEPNKIAYLYDSSKSTDYDVDSDPAYAVISGTDNIVEAIDIKDFTAESTDTINALESNYDLVVVSEGPNSGHKFASSLLGMVNRVPMLNMKSFFYKSGVWGWGTGENPKPAPSTIVLTEAGAAHPVLGSLGYGVGEEVELYIAPDDYTGNIIQGYTASEGSLIANDAVLATVGDGVNAIHEHGTTNKYMLYPFSSDAAVAGVEFTEDATNLLLAIVDYLADTKTKVRPAAKPAINITYDNGVTTVDITTGIEGATIYYTIDGTEPTSASPVYSDDLVFTEAAVVKAFVSATGYNDSEVASAEIVVKSKLAVPTISIVRNADNSEVTLATTTEGSTIYFNFTGDTNAATSQAYTEPIVLTEPATVYAFVSGGDYLDSEVVSEYVGINSLTAETIRLDTIAHFDANPTDWFLNDTENGGSGEAKAYYFNGKNAWNYYSTEIIGTEPVLGEDGVQLKTEDGRDSVKNIYSPDPAALKVFNPLNENGWVIKSAGQVLTLEGNLDAQAGVGNGATGRYAETAIDAIGGAPTKGCITFGGKTSGDPYTASIETTGAYAGPFDVLVAVGNGNGSGKGILEIQTSVDGATWATLDTLNLADTQRYYKRTRVAYNETASVYVRLAQTGGGSKAQVYDILLLNNGELSKQYTEQGSGIELPSVTGAEVVGVQIYNASGIQQRELGRGLNIVRQLYSDGSVKVLKIMGK
ncbi:MAG: chitobiase/beta-hexosaminidase C-terminal domain-containing protein [Bacteroidaceae bacterium]|nr:chitobiase/beta-hexosaminidase C-terminal domain-containing protein [Bacteroidaceae bacterium]